MGESSEEKDIQAYLDILNVLGNVKSIKGNLLRFNIIGAALSAYHAYFHQRSRIDIPQVTLKIDRSPSGKAIYRHVTRNSYLPPACQALTILELPHTYDLYTKSRSRQSFRTNITKTKKLGLVCRKVGSDEFLSCVKRLIIEGSDIKYLDLLQKACTAQHVELWVCSKQDGQEIALALLTVNNKTALLNYLCSSSKYQELYARWALSGAIIKDLIGQKIEYLLAERVIDTDLGNVYFQRRLGYKPAMITLVKN